MNPPNQGDIRTAILRLAAWLQPTPVRTSVSLNTLSGAELFFKCENLQKTGAFKARGATNAVFRLSAGQAARGVATHSSGNHGAALAMAAAWRGIPAYVVMPKNAPEVKRRAVLDHGGKVFLCEPTLAAREEELNKVVAETGAAFIPPFNHPDIIAGQATAAWELLTEIKDLDIVLAPVGGGGLLSGTALTVQALRPAAQTWGAEPLLANDAYLSLQEGRIMPVQSTQTIADGLRTSLGHLTFPIIRQHVPRILTVTEEGILRAMRLIWEEMQMVVEPSGAVPFAAVLEHQELFQGRRAGLILSGGNVDRDGFSWLQ